MRTLLTTVGLILVAGASAEATTVQVRSSYDPGYRGSGHWIADVTVTAAAGAGDELHVVVTPEEVLVSDPAAATLAGPGCLGASDGVTRCVVRPDASVSVNVSSGDGDDRVTVAGPHVTFVAVDAGDGDDEVSVRSGLHATIMGGAGADRLVGAADALNHFAGGSGADEMVGGAAADAFDEGSDDRSADRIDGGAGRDIVSYAGRAEAVDIDLAGGTGGPAGEGDVLVGIERAEGGDAGGRVLGTDGADELFSGAGIADGRGGHDVLRGERGGTVLCGDGFDDVTGVPAAVGLDCERLEVGPVVLRADHTPGRIAYRVSPVVAELEACAAEAGGRVTRLRRGRGRVVLPRGASTLRLRVARRCPARGPRLRPASPGPITLVSGSSPAVTRQAARG